MSAIDTAKTITEWVGRAAAFGEGALPVARFIAGFFPGAAPVVDIVTAALPIIHRIAESAPTAVNAIEAGRPIFDAISKASPSLLSELKKLYAVAVNADPARPETSLAPENVSDAEVVQWASFPLLGRAWTPEEEGRWFDKAAGKDW